MTDDRNESNALEADLENRLDELFGDDNAQMVEAEAVNPSDERLSDLKSSVLSIDWEITDEGLQQFASQISATRDSFKDDKIVLMFLQILGSLGDYIKSNRGKAHPKTFKILTSVFSGLEMVVTQSDMTEIEKKKTLQVELKRYNELRGLIQKNKAKPKGSKATVRAVAVETGPTQAVQPTPEEAPVSKAPEAGEAVGMDQIMAAIEDLKEFVRTEIEALRKEIVR